MVILRYMCALCSTTSRMPAVNVRYVYLMFYYFSDASGKLEVCVCLMFYYFSDASGKLEVCVCLMFYYFSDASGKLEVCVPYVLLLLGCQL